MPKTHPFEQDQLRTFKPRKENLDDLLQKLTEDVTADLMSRNAWERRMGIYYDRRYARADRNPEGPWPGSSNIVMPVEDMKVDEVKAALVRVFLSDPIADFKLNVPDPRLMEQAVSDRLYFNWRLRFGMQDFPEQMIIAFDSLCQNGIAVTKTFWDHRRVKLNRTFRRRDFLSRYPQLIGSLNQTFNAMDFVRQPFAQPVQGRAQGVANQVWDAVRPVIADFCDFAPDVPEDRDALSKIVSSLKAGQLVIPYQTIEVQFNASRTVTIDPMDYVVNGRSSRDNAPRKTHRLFMSESMLKKRAEEQGWSKAGVDRVLDSSDKPDGTAGAAVLSSTRLKQVRQEFREGTYDRLPGSDKIYEVWETHWHLDINGDGIDEPVWCLFHPSTKTLLKDIRVEPYEHGEDPFNILTFELNDQRFYSPRGIPEKIDDLAWEITERHRSKINKTQMMNPCFTRLIGGVASPQDVGYVPGEWWDVTRHDALAPVPIPDFTLPDEKEELILTGWIERYLGSFDTRASQQGIHEARTKTEIDAIQKSARDLLALRLMVVGLGLSKILGKIWDLENQYGSNEEYQRVTGKNFVRKSKKEIRRDYSIVPVGRLESTDPILQQQNALVRLETLAKIVELNGGNTVFENRFQVSLGEALRQWLEAMDPESTRAIIQELPEEQQQLLAQEASASQERRRNLEENLPMGIEDTLEGIREIGRKAPFGRRQRVLTAG